MEIENWLSCRLKNLKYRLRECKRGQQIEMRNVFFSNNIRYLHFGFICVLYMGGPFVI